MNFILKVFVFLLFSIELYTQSEFPHVLVFKDGKEIRGKVVVWNKSKIIFRKADTNQKESYKYKILKKIIDYDTGKEYEGLLVLRQLKGTSRTLKLTKAVSGKVECFYISSESSSSALGIDADTVSSTYFIM